MIIYIYIYKYKYITKKQGFAQQGVGQQGWKSDPAEHALFSSGMFCRILFFCCSPNLQKPQTSPQGGGFTFPVPPPYRSGSLTCSLVPASSGPLGKAKYGTKYCFHAHGPIWVRSK